MAQARASHIAATIRPAHPQVCNADPTGQAPLDRGLHQVRR
jgi:hypothetical protein